MKTTHTQRCLESREATHVKDDGMKSSEGRHAVREAHEQVR